jgi:hypothetical protein
MSRAAAPPPVCDGPGCGKQKQQANRWWGMAVSMRGWDFELRLWPGEHGEPRPPEECWDLYDFCGETCALKFISEQMSRVKS